MKSAPGPGYLTGDLHQAKYGRTSAGGTEPGPMLTQLHYLTGHGVYYRLPRKSAPGMPGPFYLMCGVSTTLFGKGYDTFEQSFILPKDRKVFPFSGKSSRYGLNVDLGVAIHR
ncbi:MAG: hypothetical protein MZV63_71915 [Marinilabiliales bacterium]|nr:hypothetical protein [Marinilabiliales bacterium]